jgi:hypothetical protein
MDVVLDGFLLHLVLASQPWAQTATSLVAHTCLLAALQWQHPLLPSLLLHSMCFALSR